MDQQGHAGLEQGAEPQLECWIGHFQRGLEHVVMYHVKYLQGAVFADSLTSGFFIVCEFRRCRFLPANLDVSTTRSCAKGADMTEPGQSRGL